MNERMCTVGDVELCYETFGDPRDPTLLLIMGLGTQMIAWHEEFCGALVGEGFHVVRFDNRDSGRSTHFSHTRTPTLGQIVRRSRRAGSYLLADMAADAAGLIGHLGVDSAHVVGVSMGGMIAQTLAARHPDRVRSLTSIMSTTGRLVVGRPAVRLYPYLLRRAPSDPRAGAERMVRVFRAIGSPGFDRDEAWLRAMVAQSFERDGDPVAAARQLGAIVASGDRTAELRGIRAPTLVIHGTADRLVRPSGGRATARAIPGARLMLIEGMGHDLPRAAWPQIVGAIAEHARAADRGATATAAA
jgi:pimeloyl-ACP methyl ester carboxylesterase